MFKRNKNKYVVNDDNVGRAIKITNWQIKPQYMPPIIITNTYEPFDNDTEFYNFSFLGRFFNKIAESVTTLSGREFEVFARDLVYYGEGRYRALQNAVEMIISEIQEYNKLYMHYNNASNPFCTTLDTELNKTKVINILAETMVLYEQKSNKGDYSNNLENDWVKNNQKKWFDDYKIFIDAILSLLEAEYKKFFDYARPLFNVNPEILNIPRYYPLFSDVNKIISNPSLSSPAKKQLLYSFFCMDDVTNYWKKNNLKNINIINSFKLHGKNLYFISLIITRQYDTDTLYYSLLEKFLKCLPMLRINHIIQYNSEVYDNPIPSQSSEYSTVLTINSISVSLFKISETLSNTIFTFPETTYTCTEQIGNNSAEEIQRTQTQILYNVIEDKKRQRIIDEKNKALEIQNKPQNVESKENIENESALEEQLPPDYNDRKYWENKIIIVKDDFLNLSVRDMSSDRDHIIAIQEKLIKQWGANQQYRINIFIPNTVTRDEIIECYFKIVPVNPDQLEELKTSQKEYITVCIPGGTINIDNYFEIVEESGGRKTKRCKTKRCKTKRRKTNKRCKTNKRRKTKRRKTRHRQRHTKKY